MTETILGITVDFRLPNNKVTSILNKSDLS